MEWISVADREPEFEYPGILTCDAHKNVHMTREVIAMETEKHGRLYFDDSHIECFFEIMAGKKPKINTCVYGNRITHWMPLPEPPKE